MAHLCLPYRPGFNIIRENIMAIQSVTVEQVREVQDAFKAGVDFQKEKKFKEAIVAFKQGASINCADENHLSELSKKLKAMSVKLTQESLAYMGCAAVHLNELIHELSEEERDLVPVDKSLSEAFESWD